MPFEISKRILVKGLTGIGVIVALPSHRSRADALTRLKVDDPDAKKLGYLEDASKVDARTNPNFAPGQSCENCLLLEGKPGESFRPCNILPGKLVNAHGWCRSWTIEM